jgi:hypothetical protein
VEPDASQELEVDQGEDVPSWSLALRQPHLPIPIPRESAVLGSGLS